MKIKNLTIGKIKDICKSTNLKQCRKGNCPLFDHQWCCLGLRNMTTKELESNILIKQERKYIALVKKHRTYDDGFVYREQTHYCFNDFESVVKEFDTGGYMLLDELVIKYRKSKKVIYKGRDYNEFLKLVEKLKCQK